MRMFHSLVNLVGLVLAVAYVFRRHEPRLTCSCECGSTMATAFVSAGIGLCFFNRPAPVSRVFPVIFVVEKASLLPVISDLASRSESHSPRYDGQIDQRHSLLQTTRMFFDFIPQLYHGTCRRCLLTTWPTNGSGTWRMKTRHFVSQSSGHQCLMLPLSVKNSWC